MRDMVLTLAQTLDVARSHAQKCVAPAPPNAKDQWIILIYAQG